MTLSDPNRGFKVYVYLLKSNVSKMVQSYYRILIGNHNQSIEWYHFQ